MKVHTTHFYNATKSLAIVVNQWRPYLVGSFEEPVDSC